MLIYGDVEHTEYAAAVRASIARMMIACLEMPSGLKRHEILVQAFTLTGELVQGLADQEFRRTGADDMSERQDVGAKLLLMQAREIVRSWRNLFDGIMSFPEDWADKLDLLDSADPVRMKHAEGYAFYALYPETYIEAASKSNLAPETVVIGIRSIGTSLAALVSATLGAKPAYTLRPKGHPFERYVQVTPAYSKLILSQTKSDFAIVDEGPGFSGSSFGCVGDWLQANGVEAQRLHFFPSHAGEPGPYTSKSHRTRWQDRPRHVVSFDDIALTAVAPKRRLHTWAADVVGVTGSSWRDLSGGAWRAIGYRPAFWPPSYKQMEKRKFLMAAEGQVWHVKFAGLCGGDVEKARRGSLLSEAGFIPTIAGTCYGFLVEEWIDGTPLANSGLSRRHLVDHVGRYLGFRARHLSARHGGASIRELCEMAIVNVAEAAGSDTAEKLRHVASRHGRLAGRLRRVDTDNRLHPWEWLTTPAGRIMKTDALDHNAAHDLVGCQDIAWDVAGACVEFELSSKERDSLVDIVSREADWNLCDDVLVLFEACYLGFQIGLWSHAGMNVDLAETERTECTVKRYLKRLAELIGS
jgi:hypothetical protein